MATLRHATPADIPTLVGLLGALFALEADFTPDPERQRRGLLRMLEEPERRLVLVAEERGAVVGMVTVQLVVSTAEGGEAGQLEDLVVAEASRGAGVGRSLVEAAERWARAHGATRLQLLADRGNAPALGFYARVGWAPTRLVCLRRGGR
jgi:GNAT superfamily N-acetyltransferase